MWVKVIISIKIIMMFKKYIFKELCIQVLYQYRGLIWSLVYYWGFTT